LELGKEGSIMMSDGAAAFAMVADEMGITQLLCTYQFSLDLFSTTTQIDVILRDSSTMHYSTMPCPLQHLKKNIKISIAA
jgi:hypothetical protein